MEDRDWSWYIEYGSIMDRNYNQQPASPRPVLTGTNLETNCRSGVIELRRSPTGILLDQVDCQLGLHSNFCDARCEMWNAKSVTQLFKEIFEPWQVVVPGKVQEED